MTIEPSKRRHMSVLAAVGAYGGTYEEVLARTNIRMSERDFALTFGFLRDSGVLNRDASGVVTRDMQKWHEMMRARET